MQRFVGHARATNGVAVPNPSVTVYDAGTLDIATIFSDNAFTAKSNPFTGEVDGAFIFYAQGRYDTVLSAEGYAFHAADTQDILLYDPNSVISPAQLTGDQNDYNPINGRWTTTWRLNANATRTITGIVAGFSGQLLRLINTNADDIILAHESASSAVANRIITGTGANITMNFHETVTLWYDSTSQRWRAVERHI
jgi:hypothetical protein